MTTAEFLNELENFKIVPPEIMQKLRSKIEKTDKDVSAKSIAKYLIDKGYLTNYQANQILTGATKAAASEELDLDVPSQQTDDTNELLKDLNPAANATKPTIEQTRNYTEQDIVDLGDADIGNEIIEPVGTEMLQQDFDPISGQPVGGYDPLGGSYDGDLGGEEEADPNEVFRGKKSKKNQWDSRWIYIGSSILALLGMLGVILAFTIFKADSSKLWETAVDNFNNGRYSQALADFENYVKSFPSDSKVADAQVKIANCTLRTSYDSKQWENTLTRAETVLPELLAVLEEEEQVEKFGDLRSELGVILPGTALGFSSKGLDSDDVEVKKSQLALAEQTMQLIDNPTYVPSSEKRKPGVATNLTLLADNIAKIKRQITMERDYVTAVDSMNSLTDSGDTKAAFQTFLELTSKYPELKVREEIQQAMMNISLREAELVETIDVDLATPDRPASPISSSVVLATKTGKKSILGLSNEMLVYLIDGTLYGIQAVDGNVIWQRYLGVETLIEPVWLGEPNKSDVIAVDSENHDLIRFSSTDGAELWRVNIGEPFAQPNVTPLGLLVTTRSGKVMNIEPADGSTGQAAQVPKECSVSGVVISGLPFIYQLADDSNLYVISAETMTCREVFYLGHDPGSVSVRPFVISGFMLVPVNAANYCNLHVLKPFENGLKLDDAQTSIRFKGQVKSPIIRYNRWAIVMSDTGDLQMIEINKADEELPAETVVSQAVAVKRVGSNYLLADSQQLWICGGYGIRRFRIQNAVGKFSEKGVTNNLDAFLGPLSLNGETLFHLRRRSSSSMVSVSAVDSETLKEIWRTDFAAPLAGPPITDGDRMIAVSAQGDVFEITDDVVDQGRSNSPSVRGSTVVQSLVFDNMVDFGDRYVVTGPADRKSILALNMSESPPSKLSELQPPADKPACDPVAFGDTLLVATKRGQVFRIDPRTGRPVGAPFQPPLTPNTDTFWRRPLVLDSQKRFMIGDAEGQLFLVESEGDNSLQKIHELQLDGLLLSPLVGAAGSAYAVVRDDSGDLLVGIPYADQMQVTGSVALPGGYVAGPLPIGDDLMVVLVDTGETVCFNTALEQQWAVEIPPGDNDQLAGAPVLLNGQLVMAFVSGKIVAVDPASGEVKNSVDLGRPISHPPVELNGKLLVTGTDGTLHQLDALNW
ncbi:MAG: PQQ-binding-like beta-propeller repeat protein [Pirellulaceae bacterium]|nr:PQQ-binding-like beta-propeller repeat protein [Pirellulaceae bacterium]MDG2104962.1 PQQ-binding-like beta-propeller repeat protein [Pirellulaceae bacterium]